MVVTGSKSNHLALWDTAESNPIARVVPLPAEHVRFSPHQENGGIHDIALNPSRNLLASGSSNPNEVLFRLFLFFLISFFFFFSKLAVFDTETWRPRALCVGHRDWIFGTQFVSDNVIFTCSRDKSLQVWRVPDLLDDDHQPPAVLEPCRVALTAHSSKVRALRYNPNHRLLASLSSDATVHFWDPERSTPLTSLRCPSVEDLVCLEVDVATNVFACGGRQYVCVMDPRIGETVVRYRWEVEPPNSFSHPLLSRVSSVNEGQGVRSVGFCRNVLSIGGGRGRLSFYDLVAAKFVECRVDPDLSRNQRFFHVMGPGFLSPNNPAPLDESETCMAIYTHSWDRHQKRLFIGGGPLLVGKCLERHIIKVHFFETCFFSSSSGVDGSYAALW